MGYKIVYNKKGCIGAGECETLSPQYWKMMNTGKATLIHGASLPNSEVFEIPISDEEAAKQKVVASSCPAGCIKVVKA